MADGASPGHDAGGPPRKGGATERSRWAPVAAMMAGAQPVSLNAEEAARWRDAPRELLANLTFYKFAARMVGENQTVLDVGCGEGLGTWLLAVECGRASGIDPDRAAIEAAKANWTDDRVSFAVAGEVIEPPVAGGVSGEGYGGVVVGEAGSLLPKGGVGEAVDRLASHLAADGTLVMAVREDGTMPGRRINKQFDLWLEATEAVFVHVLTFSMFGEVLSPGLRTGAGRMVLVACRRRERG